MNVLSIDIASATSATYIVASLLFILSLAGLSKHESAKSGLTYGIVGMGVALLFTVLLVIDVNDVVGKGAAIPLMLVAIGAGAAIGLWRAKIVEMTGMPELIAALHSFVGLAAVLIGINGHLEGSHLIEVVEPERARVLIDSPQALARWGGGNLAATFRSGHGTILDSANHFEGQGFRSASNVSEPEERMAYAVDHLGLSYARLRELRKEKFWAKSSAAAENMKDLTVFRLITNFVWLKHESEE